MDAGNIWRNSHQAIGYFDVFNDQIFKITDVIYSDFAKAFDHADQNKLISTLDSIGIGKPLLSFFLGFDFT